jgi:hypothetical protein
MSNSLLWKPAVESLIRGDVMEKIAAEMVASAKGMSPLGPLLRKIEEGSLLPPYGTVLRLNFGPRGKAMFEGLVSTSARGAIYSAIALDTLGPVADVGDEFTITDRELLRDWDIVEDA